MNKKKLTGLICSVLLVVAMCVATVCGCGSKENYSEAFEGVVSEESFETSESAASAFIANEISTEENPVQFGVYTKEAELTSDEVSQMNIKVDGEIESVEKGKVSYSEVTLAKASNEYYITVYIIKFTPTGAEISEFKYYAPLPENGARISKAYFDSVFNSKNYANCTITSSISSTVSAGGVTQTSTIEYAFKISETAAIMSMTMKLAGETTTATVYFVKGEDGSLSAAREIDGNLTIVNSSEYASLNIKTYDDIYKSMINDFDYAYFVKTDFGFEMDGKYMEDVMGAAMNTLGIEMEAKMAYFRYYIQNGNLYKIKYVYDASGSLSGQTVNVKSEGNTSYADYGATTVTVPQNVKDLLGING